MSHARVEELSDSDPDIDDPSQFLPDDDLSVIRPANFDSSASSAQSAGLTFGHSNTQQFQSRPSEPPLFPSSNAPPQTVLQPQGPSAQSRAAQAQAREAIKPYCSIYPIYFDSTRSRATGRRVSAKLATANPLAFTILEAVKTVIAPHMLQLAFEPEKMHPQDWSNPGRVRVQLFDKDTHKPLHPTIKSKSHLFILIAKYLQEHPTTKNDPLKLRIQGLPIPEGGIPPPAVPRGWKVNGVLPLHSCAVSGGGVSDNFFKDAMEELRQAQQEGGGQLPPGMNGMAGMLGGAGGGAESSGGGAAKKKKEKKKG